MPGVCEGGGEAQGGGYGGSASCGSAPRCRTLCQARLRECKSCMQKGCGLQRSSRSDGENTKCCREIRPIATRDSHSEVSGSIQEGTRDGQRTQRRCGVKLKARTST